MQQLKHIVSVETYICELDINDYSLDFYWSWR